VRYQLNDYSVPTSYGYCDVLVRGYVHEVVISCGAEMIARHPRSYEREDFVFEPLHYLALIEWARRLTLRNRRYLEIKYVCLGGPVADRDPGGPYSAGDTGTNAP